jgi:hypothetical protein
MDFGTYPIKIGQELPLGDEICVAEIPVSFNHDGGEEWWGGYFCDV